MLPAAEKFAAGKSLTAGEPVEIHRLGKTGVKRGSDVADPPLLIGLRLQLAALQVNRLDQLQCEHVDPLRNATALHLRAELIELRQNAADSAGHPEFPVRRRKIEPRGLKRGPGLRRVVQEKDTPSRPGTVPVRNSRKLDQAVRKSGAQQCSIHPVQHFGFLGFQPETELAGRDAAGKIILIFPHGFRPAELHHGEGQPELSRCIQNDGIKSGFFKHGVLRSPALFFKNNAAFLFFNSRAGNFSAGKFPFPPLPS